MRVFFFLLFRLTFILTAFIQQTEDFVKENRVKIKTKKKAKMPKDDDDKAVNIEMIPNMLFRSHFHSSISLITSKSARFSCQGMFDDGLLLVMHCAYSCLVIFVRVHVCVRFYRFPMISICYYLAPKIRDEQWISISMSS